MPDLREQALAATARIRRSSGYQAISPPERAELARDLDRIEAVLAAGHMTPNGGTGSPLSEDPYAIPFAGPNDPRAPGGFIGPGRQATPPAGREAPTATQPAAPPPRPAGTEVLGERARRALDAVDFPAFVAELIEGTFQAIVDATARQVREYAKLVAEISRSVDDFTRENVTRNQARDWLLEKYPRDLMLILPGPGEDVEPRLAPHKRADESPQWLADFGLEGEDLTEELVEGPLLRAGQRALGEDRMRTLATMVLMGVNRIVVDDGQLRARLQFHARARERVSAEIVGRAAGQQVGIAARQSVMRSAISTMVSTVDVNAQSDVSIKTELVGEVAVRFRTETFDLNNFADAPTVSVITRHSLSREGAEAAAAQGVGQQAAAATPETASETGGAE